MDRSKDTWTFAHDLALIYIALAYGTDRHLTDAELETITATLQGWRAELGREEVQEVVMEAMAIFFEERAEHEVVRSIQSLKQVLSKEELQRVLEEVVQIARADGIVLSNERSLIHLLAQAWELKTGGGGLLSPAAGGEEALSWGLMHHIGLIYLVVAHSTDNELSSQEIEAILLRLNEWQPELEEEEIRRVLREALEFYATGPDEESLRNSVRAIRDALPMMQRLVLLDDLVYIAEADGTFRKEEKEMIDSISQAWNISVRLNGRMPS